MIFQKNKLLDFRFWAGNALILSNSCLFGIHFLFFDWRAKRNNSIDYLDVA